mmetsp:Transcript_39393/g.94133  ORF Transcript_39393/g.94133 Transcript_39393/m.94133 type:complete len:242 (+) Transcript_39393:469-1194(+)
MHGGGPIKGGLGQVRLVVAEHGHHLQAAGLHGVVHGRPACEICEMNIGLAVDEHHCALVVAMSCRKNEAGKELLHRLAIDLSSHIQLRLHNLEVVVPGSGEQALPSPEASCQGRFQGPPNLVPLQVQVVQHLRALVQHVGIGAVLRKDDDQVHAAAHHGPYERSPAMLILCIDIGSILQGLHEILFVPALRSGQQRLVPLLRLQECHAKLQVVLRVICHGHTELVTEVQVEPFVQQNCQRF